MNLRLNRKRLERTQESGSSLVETMIGMAVLGTTFVALYTALTSGFSSVRFARENLRATQIIVDKTEAIRLYGWQRLNDPTFRPTNFWVSDATPVQTGKTSTNTTAGTVYRGTITVAPPPFAANYSSRMKLVTVRLDWITDRVPRSRQITTLVAFDGLYSYVY